MFLGEVVKYRKYEKTFVLRSNELRQMMYFNETAMTRQEGNFFRSASETFSVLNKVSLKFNFCLVFRLDLFREE